MPSQKKPAGENGPDNNQKRIIDAAIACFQTIGAVDTTMEDIARTAKLGRKTVYRTFPNRNALIDAVAIERINILRDRIKEVVDDCASFDEAVISGIVESLRSFRQDPIMMAAIDATNDHGVERYLIDPRSPMLQKMLYVWQGAFARARKAGELRDDLSDEAVSSWLLGVHLFLLMREDMDPEGQRTLISQLVMPGLRPMMEAASRKPRGREPRS